MKEGGELLNKLALELQVQGMLVHLITAALVVGSVSVQGELPTVSITRSGEGDVLSVSSLGVSCNQSCNVTQHTYLVEDRRCVDNTELHNTSK